MTADVQDRLHEPKPPRIGGYIAVLLEISIVAVLAAEHSVIGLLLCAGYAWFSATWALFANLLRGGD